MSRDLIRSILDRRVANVSPACAMLSSAEVCRNNAMAASTDSGVRHWALRCVAYTHGILSPEYAELENLLDYGPGVIA